MKTIFIAFAKEDENQRNLFTGQSVHPKSPFEFIDMSVTEPYPTKEWKDKVRTRIKRSHGVIALISDSTYQAEGQLWEIEIAKEEGKPILGIWAYSRYQASPTWWNGIKVVTWSWTAIADFIDGL